MEIIMKIVKVLFGLLIILVLISSYPALAQEVDPPRWQGPELDGIDPYTGELVEAPLDTPNPAVDIQRSCFG
jgi:hypothetical protein